MIRQESFNRSVRSTHIPKGFTAILGDLKWAKTARINAKKNFCVVPAYENCYKRILDES